MIPLRIHPPSDSSQEPLILQVFNHDQVSWHTCNSHRGLVFCMVTPIGTRNWFPWGSILILNPFRNHWSSKYSIRIKGFWYTYNGPRVPIFVMATSIGTRSWFPWGSILILTPIRNPWSSKYSIRISCLGRLIMVIEV